MNLDIAAVDDTGAVVLLGEAKTEARQIHSLAAELQQFQGDPGKAPPRAVTGSPQGQRREAWKLAHQMWSLRSPYLWLIASGERLCFETDYRDGLKITSRECLPTASELWPTGFTANDRPPVLCR